MPNTEMTSEKLMAIILAAKDFADNAKDKRKKECLGRPYTSNTGIEIDSNKIAAVLLDHALSNPEIANVLLSSD
ncbi:MAG: hypothetical protein NTW35_02955 [Candidatus Nomurabacteria bacterium]|nr:hypothetical protein [Candidatus Nomurabacteria bacterium]